MKRRREWKRHTAPSVRIPFPQKSFGAVNGWLLSRVRSALDATLSWMPATLCAPMRRHKPKPPHHPADLSTIVGTGIKKKLPPSPESIVSQEILEIAQKSLETDRPTHTRKCGVCGSSCPVSTGAQPVEDLCWVCRRLKISAWRDSDPDLGAEIRARPVGLATASCIRMLLAAWAAGFFLYLPIAIDLAARSLLHLLADSNIAVHLGGKPLPARRSSTGPRSKRVQLPPAVR